ncbi:hypothetical protein [Streptosporangium sp. NPDC002607]
MTSFPAPRTVVSGQVDSLQHLHRSIDQIRRAENVIGTRTLMVPDSWRRVERPS